MQHTWADLEGDESSLMAQLILLLAGREAERLLLGTVSAGAGGPEESDLARASEIAAAMEVSYGLGTDGPLWRATRRCAVDVMADDLSLRARVRARLDAAEKRAMATLVVNKAALQQIAATLGEASVVYGADLTALLSGVVSEDGSSALEARP
jgi:ATP-dependent Zn protease